MKTKRPKWQRISLLIVSILLASAFLIAGGMKLSGAEEMANNFARWGFSGWFMYLTGAIEFGAAILLLIPRTRFLGAFALTMTMVGAVITHVIHAEAAQALPALVLGVVAGFLAFSHRPHLLVELFLLPAHSHNSSPQA